MKIAFAIIILFTHTVTAQSVGIGTSSPHASARLQISSSTQGILIPTMTATQRNAISNPATGLMVFQSDGTPGFYYYAGGGWVNLTSGHTANNEGAAFSRYYGLTYTLAGNGTEADVDAQGSAARFNHPAGLAVDGAGNVYVADQLNNKIRKITSTGLVSTFAGTGAPGAGNGTRLSATFDHPIDIVLDAFGNLYVADRNNNRIRKIAADGMVSTLAGSTEGFADAPGDLAQFDRPTGLAVDAAGNVYVADESNHRIRKITPAGMVSTVAGSSSFGYVDGPISTAIFRGPLDVALDAAGNIYVAEGQNNVIRKIDLVNGQVSTFAGDINAASGDEDGVGTAARFSIPHGLAIDLYGNIYVADRGNHKIRKITPAREVSTLSGSGAFGAEDGAGGVATFIQPVRLATDAFGDVYVADYINARVRKIIAQ